MPTAKASPVQHSLSRGIVERATSLLNVIAISRYELTGSVGNGSQMVNMNSSNI